MTVTTVYAVFADGEEAERIGQAMVAERLAACVNILAPCQSFYRWQGAIKRATEVPALFKTSTAKVDALIARIADLHSFDAPAIVAWPVDRLSLPYAEWVESELR